MDDYEYFVSADRYAVWRYRPGENSGLCCTRLDRTWTPAMTGRDMWGADIPVSIENLPAWVQL